jgi:hypothetical protein
MGTLATIPGVGNEFNLYFPCFLLILFVCSLFDVYKRVIHIFKRDEAIERDLEGKRINLMT